MTFLDRAQKRDINGVQRAMIYQELVGITPGVGEIEGLPTPEARMFIRDLNEHATQPRFVYSHRWTQWDLVMWDNRVTMHRARRYDHTAVRDLHRTTVASDGPTIEQEVAAA